MSTTYFVRNKPFAQLTGTSHGMHVTTEGSAEYAAETQTRVGRQVIDVTVCEDVWNCDCVSYARVLNKVTFGDQRF